MASKNSSTLSMAASFSSTSVPSKSESSIGRLSRSHDRGGLGGRADGHDFEVDQLAPGGAPGFEQSAVIGLHNLPAGVEVEVHPAGDVLEPVSEVPTFLAKA